MLWNVARIQKLLERKWMRLTYDAMIIELMCLGMLTLVHGKNLFYTFDIYPVALFLFMLPLTVASICYHLFGLRKNNDVVLLLGNLACLFVIGRYILVNYYIHPAAYRTGGYALFGDSTLYNAAPSPEERVRIYSNKGEVSSISVARNKIYDSVHVRYAGKPHYKFLGLSLQPDTMEAGNKPTYTGYALYMHTTKTEPDSLMFSLWHITYTDSVWCLGRMSVHIGDTIMDPRLRYAVRDVELDNALHAKQ